MQMDMSMDSRVPEWLTPLSWAVVVLALASAFVVAADVWLGRRRHRTVTSEVVWVASGLFLGPVAVWLYAREGRRPRRPAGAAEAPGLASDPGEEASPVAAALPGGSASALAHLVGVPLVVASGLTIAGTDLWVMILVIGAVAVALLAVHERVESVGRGRHLAPGAALAAAALTVLAFDLGMGGWMLLLHYGSFMPPATDAAFWFLMQLGVVLGLATGYPAVAWLARRDRAAVAA